VEGECHGEREGWMPGPSVPGFWAAIWEKPDALRFPSPQPPRQRRGVKGGRGGPPCIYKT
jgi:hypothetical protein